MKLIKSQGLNQGFTVHVLTSFPVFYTYFDRSDHFWTPHLVSNPYSYDKPFEQIHIHEEILFSYTASHQHTEAYHIIALFGTCAYSWKTLFWDIIENAGVPILHILQLISVRLYSNIGACSLRVSKNVTIRSFYDVHLHFKIPHISTAGSKSSHLICPHKHKPWGIITHRKHDKFIITTLWNVQIYRAVFLW